MKTLSFFFIPLNIRNLWGPLVLLSLNSIAAPMPGGAPFIHDSLLSIFRSEYKFSVSANGTAWKLHKTPLNSAALALFKPPGAPSASLSLRFEELSSQKTPKQYLNQWLQEYPRLGFKVLHKSKLTLKGNSAFIIDLYSPFSKNQLRQIVFFKNNKSVTFTCRHNRKQFPNTIKECHKIVRNFRWL